MCQPAPSLAARWEPDESPRVPSLLSPCPGSVPAPTPRPGMLQGRAGCWKGAEHEAWRCRQELSLLRGPLSSPSPASWARWQIPCRSTAVQLYCRRPGFDVFLTALESQPLFFHPALPRERLSASPCPTTTFEPAAGFQTGLMEGQRSQRSSSQQGWWARGAGGARGETKTWLLCRRDNGLRAAVANLWRKREKI